MLFHVVNERHLRRRPLLFTTNKSLLTECGLVLHDPDLAEAIVDRTLETGRLILLDGPSYRTRHLDLANKMPEFPENRGQIFRNLHMRLPPLPGFAKVVGEVAAGLDLRRLHAFQ